MHCPKRWDRFGTMQLYPPAHTHTHCTHSFPGGIKHGSCRGHSSSIGDRRPGCYSPAELARDLPTPSFLQGSFYTSQVPGLGEARGGRTTCGNHGGWCSPQHHVSTTNVTPSVRFLTAACGVRTTWKPKGFKWPSKARWPRWWRPGAAWTPTRRSWRWWPVRAWFA